MRRTRKDRQSRDFVCPCGKAYLSYPALHTHIKKYHDKKQKMMDRAIYPVKTKDNRGRPKKELKIEATAQFQELTVFETAVLNIYQSLIEVLNAPILLQGNQEVEQASLLENLSKNLEEISLQYEQSMSSAQLFHYEQMLRPIIKGLLKHFTIDISKKIHSMVLVGYLQMQVNRSSKEQIIKVMRMHGWPHTQNRVAEELFDVLLRALQGRRFTFDVLSWQDERM